MGMMTSGLSAMIRCAAALELDAENVGRCVETLSIGSAEDGSGYALQIAGRHLCYMVTLCGDQVRVSAGLLDSTAAPEFLLTVKDCEAEWETVFHFVSSLEKYEVQSLERPIQVGNPVIHPPAECWIIG